MKDLQAKWDKIVRITEDSENILQGLRNTIFLDLKIDKPHIINEIKYLIKIFQLIIWLPKKIKIPYQNKLLFIFPSCTPAHLNNLLPVYKEFKSEESIIIKHELVDNKFFNKLDILINIKDIPFYSKYSQRFLLFKCYSILQRLYSGNNSGESSINGIINKNWIKYFYYILLILISKNAIKTIFLTSKVRALISTSEYFPIEYSIFSISKSLKIKSFLIQHGIIGLSHIPFSADYFFVWSNCFKDEIVSKNFDLRNRIYICGSPSFETHLSYDNRLTFRKEKEKKFIILSDTHGEIVYPEPYREFRMFLDTLVPSSDYKWIVKLHPAEDKSFYSTYESNGLLKVLPKRISLQEALSDASVAFTIWSTAGLDAIIMGIPTIILDFSPEVKQYAWWPQEGGGVYYSKLLEISELLNPDFLIGIEENQKKFVDKVLGNNKNASFNIKKKIIELIEK